MKDSYLPVKCIGLVIAVFAFAGISSAQKYNKCLPPDIKEDTVIGWDNPVNSERPSTPITVRQTLAKLKAKCVCDKLVNSRGKKIRFFQLQGCWGNPPSDYLEIMENQRKEIEKLRKTYEVIEVTCDTGVPRYSIP
ncbi:MAG TPA: hypothetical protein PLL77_09150 [Pyrinomonadaceae bacterium]|nr:hypothetical protein [Pyrinomonadaceae bacterium]